MVELLLSDASSLRIAADSFASRIGPGHFVDGRVVQPRSEESLPLVHPATGEETGRVAVGLADDVDLAVRSARDAFESGAWSRRSPRERGGVLIAFADLLEAHADELALLETLDMGKPIGDARRVDVVKAAHMIRWYGEAIDKQYDALAPTAESIHAYVRRVPLGVVACVTPWNFPLYQASYKLGPVLATGNSLVIKPSELAPRTTRRAAELALQAGLPPGVFNVVTGDGPRTGAALASHPDVDCVAFTGSAATAREVSRLAASSLAKVSIEAGGKSAHLVLPGTGGLEAMADDIVDGFCYNQGQVCSAGTRLLVHQSMADELVDLVARAATRYAPGDPFDPATSLGPIVSLKQLGRVQHYVRTALDEGGSGVLLDDPGKHPRTEGNWHSPTVIDDVRPGHTIAREEVFGPVLAVIRYETVEAAVTIANDTEYALGAAVWSSRIDRALDVAHRLRAGQVWINNYDGSDLTVPWGGFKRSGHGRDKSLEALREYTGTIATWIDVSRVLE